MGNKSSVPPKGPDAGSAREDEAGGAVAGSISREGAGAPSPELLASLQSLRDNVDSTLLPHSLHQIAETYLAREDYQWAIQFLQLEKLYHERLLSNIAALQENWESQWREKKTCEGGSPAESDGFSQKHMETLSQICRTHLRPSVNVEQNTLNTALKDIQDQNEPLQFQHDEVFSDDRLEAVNQSGDQQQSSESEPSQSSEGEGEAEAEEEEEEEAGEEQMCKEGQETPEEEEVEVEWPTGVPQASDKDLAKLSVKEGSSSPDGLVSILKRRRASLDGLPPPSINVSKQNSKRKVRFSEPEDGAEPDEVGGDSCLILLLLCLVTVVISIGGTALYCTLVGSYSSICTDFTHNADFYIANVRGFLAGLRRWLPLPT
ncbi:consortin, connexin sorting protein b isoform X1 [Takifugu flavidus]|uniref:consortin, connexin sorting protein b isoform X1 n=1 Tax=Takifugu flavidus TaxID=433684 RepID=UPI0025447CB0|nr:consortin, connexin sorting protein b isoform X1 [Takifugu flavidus]